MDTKPPQMREPESWPPTLSLATGQASTSYKEESPSRSAPILPTNETNGTFEEDLDNCPEKHFLSPSRMYGYEDSDDSDPEEEFEWGAGITDFSLFDYERKRAQESDEPLSDKWSSLMSLQASALQRAVRRTRAEGDSRERPGDKAEVPSLTPDDSPDLRDDLEVEASQQDVGVPSYPTTYGSLRTSCGIVTNEDHYFYVNVEKKQQPERTASKPQRPGMRSSRTLSGRIHSWQRPSHDMYTLGEDSEAEERAEREGEVEDNSRSLR